MNYRFPASFVSAFIVIAVIVFFIVGRDHIWAAFGPADLGPVTFERLERRTTPNDALACPPGICAAKSDFESPLYAAAVPALRAAFAKVIASEPRVVLIHADESEPSERYIQRSRLMHFPDTIVVRYFERDGGRSTLALYSRSQLGKGDLGVNRARIERWLQKLGQLVPIAR